MLAHLITEPELSTAGPLDPTLAPELDADPCLAALAYAACPDGDDRWVPARRRPSAGQALPLA